MTLSLDTLRARITQVEIFDNYGNSLATVPMKTLSYTEWNNAALMVAPPRKTQRVEIGQPEQDITHTDEYRKKMSEYNEEIILRRITMSLVGGNGFPELANLDEDAQLAKIRELDAGIVYGLNKFLQGVALRTSADVFRPKPVSSSGDADLPQTEMDTGKVDQPASD